MPRHAIPPAPDGPASLDQRDLAKLSERLLDLDEDRFDAAYADFAEALNQTLSKAQRAWVLGYVYAARRLAP